MREALEQLIDSLVYEGYALYPYTPGAAKNATPTAEGQRVNPPAPPKRAQSQSTRRNSGREAAPPLPAQGPTSVLPSPSPGSQTVAAPQPDGERQ